MLSDSDLTEVYNSGFATSHLAGLKAVWNAATAAAAKATEPPAPKVPVAPAPAAGKSKWV